MNVAGGTSEALDYIQRNYLHETVIKHPQRAEAQRVWNFPYAALEEALKSTHSHGTGVAARLSRQRNAASSKKPCWQQIDLSGFIANELSAFCDLAAQRRKA